MKCKPFPFNQGRPLQLIPWLPFEKSGGIIPNKTSKQEWKKNITKL
jgi:hypothetical protein